MRHWSTWWRELSGPAKFRHYTRVTLHVGIVSVVAVMSIAGGSVWQAITLVGAGLAAIGAVEAQPALSAWPNATYRRWALPAAATALAAIWLACAVVTRTSTAETVADEARVTGILVTLLAALTVIAFTPHKWSVLLGVGVATGLAFGASPVAALQTAAAVVAVGALLVGTTLLTLWSLRIIDDLEHAKEVEAELQVAEERLRFARDLHDVVGRGFSAIAVKSELAATLSRSGAADRAAAEMDEVKALAVESMGEMRTLVRGYRDIGLEREVAGARSLLSAAGCRLDVEGDPAAVPTRFHEVAAWVVREGTTNIVRHSSATSATLTLGLAGMSLRNNGVVDEPGEGSGLRGLADRLAAVGAGLDTTAAGDEFVLEVLWEEA
ncbi:two-component system, NarL family, sensor histidine kinase DesK [Rhodococcus triatomae]|uniref:Two-component system, NarL family, sensor histidine kinase DesK n=1 Tax=Rhodococcus triatomae TaxID=300028 RepID=A0A1G8PK29_9NOCA|nr:histidine kinase [Rhodococcus triatomae]SDI92797.1 two-component system, NarL family, sensor histidine kinase DesK [Rhodococcus triatomae]